MSTTTHKYYTCKSDVDHNDLMYLNPILLQLYASFCLYAHTRGLPVNVTSIIHDRGDIQTVSTTHEDGRAIDVSSKGWTTVEVNKAEKHFNETFRSIGAISYSDGVSRAMVHHDSGFGAHFHLQIRRIKH